MERIQVLLDPEERDRFRSLAQRRGLSLSAWLREAALHRAAEESESTRIRTVDELRAFFAQCDARELGREPDWEEHLAVLDGSMREGLGVPSEGSVRPGLGDTSRTGSKGRTVSRRSTSRKRR
ncbi:MAG TPA: hypothetical protein VHR17_05225 [Thermoanaerobaculia bacterium]|nr:hypothetical protein [Thermoanaerobaculia bacterium]